MGAASIFDKIPDELQLYIFDYLDIQSVFSLRTAFNHLFSPAISETIFRRLAIREGYTTKLKAKDVGLISRPDCDYDPNNPTLLGTLQAQRTACTAFDSVRTWEQFGL